MEIYRPGDLLPYTLQGISRKYALLLGQCRTAAKDKRRGCVVRGGGRDRGERQRERERDSCVGRKDNNLRREHSCGEREKRAGGHIDSNYSCTADPRG